MEHAGAIFYNASGLLLDPSATQNQKLGRASVIAHETAHMWFGDLVTMRWFNDVWMKEVFANFMAAKIVNPSFPEINHELRFSLAHYPAAYDVDRTPGTNAIRQPLDNLNEAGTLYGAIIYQKAPIVMRQLEMIARRERIPDGLREYLRAHAFGNATWPDLIALLDARTPEDLETWSRAWVEEAGRPAVRTDLRVAGGRIARLALVQQDPLSARPAHAGASAPRRALVWTQRLQRVARLRRRDSTDSRQPERGTRPRCRRRAGLPAPRFVLPTGGGIGYGGFVLDAGEPRVSARDTCPTTRRCADARQRARHALGGHARRPVSGRRRPRDAGHGAAARARRAERRSGCSATRSRRYWKFLPPARATRCGRELERMLQDGLERARHSPSLKSAWFSALRDTAQTPRDAAMARADLEQNGDRSPGSMLAEPDYISLAQELAVRERAGVAGDSGPAAANGPRIPIGRRASRSSGRRCRRDQRVRDAFFETPEDAANRRREPWVLEGLGYLHHPLRAAASRKSTSHRA